MTNTLFRKKTGFVLFLLALLALTITACNRNGDDTIPTEASVTDVTPAEEEPPSHGGNLHAPRDLGGRVIRTMANWDDVPIQFVAWGWDEPDPATADNYFMARMIFDNAQRVYRDFNFGFEHIAVDYNVFYETLSASVMAGSPMTDIFFAGGGGALGAIQNGIIQPLSNINLPGSDLLDGPRMFSRIAVEAFGDYWGFLDARPSVSGMGLGINQDIIRAIGAPDPVELYSQGRWTWDIALEIMRMATRDTTGDGNLDQWGIAGQPGDFALHFIASNDGRLVTDDLNYGFDHPNTVQALEFIETIFHEGLWQFDQTEGFNAGDWARNFNAFQEGRAAMWPAVSWGLNNGDLPFEFSFVPFPIGPANTSGNTWMGGWEAALSFPTGIDWDPADILMVLEEFWSFAGEDVDLMMDDVLAWPRTIFMTEGCVQRVAGVTHTMYSDLGMVVPQYWWITGTFVTHFHNQSMTVLQAVEAYRGPQQELLDNFFR